MQTVAAEILKSEPALPVLSAARLKIIFAESCRKTQTAFKDQLF